MPSESWPKLGHARPRSPEERRRAAANRRTMARRKRKRPLRPRVPARVKKRQKRIRSHHENELFGLALAALGLVLAAILYLALDGGAVGLVACRRSGTSWVTRAYMLPLALLAIGGLMLARSELLDVRPFRLGLGVGFLGLMTLLGKDSGGWIGLALGGALAALIGETGAAIIGGTLLARGRPARQRRLDRRDPAPHRSRRAASRHRGAARVRLGLERVADRETSTRRPSRVEPPPRRLLDGAEAFPDIVGRPRRVRGARAARPRGHGARAREHRERVRDTPPSTPSTGFRTAGSSVVPRSRGLRARTPARASPTCSCARSPSSASTRPSSARSPARA